MKELSTQLNLRLDQDAKAKFDSLCKTYGKTQAEMFGELLSEAESSALKAHTPQISGEIEAFEVAADRIRNSFFSLAQHVADAYDAATRKVQIKLDQIDDLYQKTHEQEAEISRLQDELYLERSEKERYKAMADKNTADTKQLEKLKTENLSLRSEKVSLREKQLKEIADERAKALQEFLALHDMETARLREKG